MYFLALPADILLIVIKDLDVKGLVALSEACHLLRRLVSPSRPSAELFRTEPCDTHARCMNMGGRVTSDYIPAPPTAWPRPCPNGVRVRRSSTTPCRTKLGRGPHLPLGLYHVHGMANSNHY